MTQSPLKALEAKCDARRIITQTRRTKCGSGGCLEPDPAIAGRAPNWSTHDWFYRMSGMAAGMRHGSSGGEGNALNLGGVNASTFVYRIMSKDRLYQLFEGRENVLVSPSKWEDPFENLILSSPVQMTSGEIGSFAFHDDFYGQCWTLHTASDAMWRIYSPDKQAVRVRSTIGRLVRSLSDPLGSWAHVQSFVGKVEYLSRRQYKSFAETVFMQGLDPIALARTLLVKRPAFRHEREVRLLYFERQNGLKHAGGLYRYNVDPHALIDQLMLDPRLSPEDATAQKSKIEQKIGFKGDIKRSLLYTPPKSFVVPIG